MDEKNRSVLREWLLWMVNLAIGLVNVWSMGASNVHLARRSNLYRPGIKMATFEIQHQWRKSKNCAATTHHLHSIDVLIVGMFSSIGMTIL